MMTKSKYGKLELSNLELGMNSALFLSRLVQNHDKIKTLNISNNNFSDDGIALVS